MSNKQTAAHGEEGNTRKDPDEKATDELQQKTGRGQPPQPSEEEPPHARGRGQRSEDMGGMVDELDFDGNGSRRS
jgi:hypothetical protein